MTFRGSCILRTVDTPNKQTTLITSLPEVTQNMPGLFQTGFYLNLGVIWQASSDHQLFLLVLCLTIS